MRNKTVSILFAIILFINGLTGYSQKYNATGDENIIRGNRLISSLSANGRQLHQIVKVTPGLVINADGEMKEPEWSDALTVTPFISGKNSIDKTSVKVLYDSTKIYLFWFVDQPDGITVKMKEKDGLITSDDYIQVDLKPWLPDNIIHGRDYSYSIAVNPDGIIWDSYFDPYLEGFFYSSWNSSATVNVVRQSDSWQVEMIIPFAGLDVYSDPGWKWNLEFRHSSYKDRSSEVSRSTAGITVQQEVMVRESGLVSYYWPRPDFMQEIKPDLTLQEEKYANIREMSSVPAVNKMEDLRLWQDQEILKIAMTDKTGRRITSNTAQAAAGLSGNFLCFNLKADGSSIEKRDGTSGRLGGGMDAQMAGVNGVFVDQTLFSNECFWIILQPRSRNADNIHQDYYLIVLNNRGEIKGTHYDKYGESYNEWTPVAKADIFNTSAGWGAELMIDMRSLDIPVDYSNEWGINIFRNFLLPGKDYELQAWKFTGNDFFNPAKFGYLSGVSITNPSVFRSCTERRNKEIRSLLDKFSKTDNNLTVELRKELASIKTGTSDQLKKAEIILDHVDNSMGILQSSLYYRLVPHPPLRAGYPLMDVTFTGNMGWAVGAMGTILRTEDSGRTWEKVHINSDADLYRVKFVNEKEGWAAGGRIRIAESNKSMRHDKRGGYGYIFHTTDGGKTWECQYGERGRHLFALHFTDEKTGYAAGERGFLLKTNDGGRNWDELPTTGTLNWLYGMTFTDTNNGFAVGLNETLIKTTDGGKSWKKIEASPDRRFYGFKPIYRDICFNGSTGCIVGQNGTILISSDGGNTWEPSGTFYSREIREMMELRSVCFVDPQRGYAVGELGNKIMTTEDGGRNWTFRNTESSEWLRALWADNTGKLVVAGEREKLITSSDKGMTWSILNGAETKIDIMTMMAHGDDAPIHFNSFFAYYTINENRKIVDVGVMSDVHSSEYEETYNLEHDRNIWMTGVGTANNFYQFETGNNGANYYHYNQRLWEGEENIVRRMVAAIRAYKPDIIITHEGVYGDYDKPGHKVSGRAGLTAFGTAGGETDHWPELTRMGLEPWQPKKLYNLEGVSYPGTLDLSWIGDQPLKGTDMTCKEYGNYVIRNFQSQGVYFHRHETKLCLVKSNVPVPENEKSVFDGIDKN